MRLEDLAPETRAIVDEVISQEDVTAVHASCYSDEGVNDVKTAACDKLLAHRVENKLKGTKINSVINRIHIAEPRARDDVVREPFIPEAVKTRRKYDPEDPMRRKLEKDLEAEGGGAGVYSINTNSAHISATALSRLLMILQRTTFWPTRSGKTTSSLRLWMAKISQTLSILISSRNLMLWSRRRRNSKLKVFTIAMKKS
jgi:hypothetical protein